MLYLAPTSASTGPQGNADRGGVGVCAAGQGRLRRDGNRGGAGRPGGSGLLSRGRGGGRQAVEAVAGRHRGGVGDTTRGVKVE